MKTLSITKEIRAYTEEEAQDIIINFKDKAASEKYIVKSASYTRKTKKAKGEIIAEAWIVKCTGIYNEIWDDDEV